MSKDYSELKAAEQAQSVGISKSLYVGIPMMVLGVVFLVINFTQQSLANWWALFFLVPIAFIVMNALRSRSEVGYLDRGARATLVGAMFMFLLMLVFLFEMDWGKIWPAFLVISGLGFIIGRWGD